MKRNKNEISNERVIRIGIYLFTNIIAERYKLDVYRPGKITERATEKVNEKKSTLNNSKPTERTGEISIGGNAAIISTDTRDGWFEVDGFVLTELFHYLSESYIIPRTLYTISFRDLN